MNCTARYILPIIMLSFVTVHILIETHTKECKISSEVVCP